MLSRTKFRSLILASVAVAVAGCSTVKKPPITKVEDTFNKASSSQEVPNDIMGILAAGGLDAKNPSAPTSETKVAETKPSKLSTANDVEKLVAKLDPAATTADTSDNAVLLASLQSDKAPKSVALDVALKSSKPTIQRKDITPSNAPKAIALTSTSTENEASGKAIETVILESKPQINSVTITYPEIGVAALEQETKVVAPVVAAKPSPSRKTSRVISPLSEELASIKKPRRF